MVGENGTGTEEQQVEKLWSQEGKKSRATFIRDANRLWNKAPTSITGADTLMKAKKEINKYCNTLSV